MNESLPILRRLLLRGRRSKARSAPRLPRDVWQGLDALEPRMLLSAPATPVQVSATIETVPVAHSGDAADDMAFWIHPTDPAQSVIIGTDKTDGGGLIVYNLDGSQHQVVTAGRLNNVDVRYDFPFDGGTIDLVAVSDRTNFTIALYRVDAATRTLVSVAGEPIDLGAEYEPYGLALYRSPATGRVYAFTSKRYGDMGTILQFELFDNGHGGVEGSLVRSFDVGSLTEGLVVDDVHAGFYAGEEDVGVWLYGAEPSAGDARVMIDATGAGNIVADVEGLAVYHRTDGQGYLIVSSQGDNTFAVYELTGDHAIVKVFVIVAGVVDGASDTDGIDVTNVAMGAAFPAGALIAQDGANTGPSANQNYKYVPWETIANAGAPAMTIDTGFDPRGPLFNLDVDGNGATDALTDGILAVRYLFGFRGAALVSGAIGPGAARTSAGAIESFLAAASPAMLDVDGDGGADALSDGILIARHLFDFTGAALIDGALATGATRNTPQSIEAFVTGWEPVAIGAGAVAPAAADHDAQNVSISSSSITVAARPLIAPQVAPAFGPFVVIESQARYAWLNREQPDRSLR